jgi:hypothetical protein
MNPAKRPAREKNSLKKPLKKPRNPNKAKTQRRIKSTQFTVGNRLTTCAAFHFETATHFDMPTGPALLSTTVTGN